MAYEGRLLSEVEADIWDAFVAKHPFGRGMVATASRQWWGTNGWSLHPIGAFEAGEMVAGAAVVCKKIPCTPWRLARIEALMVNAEDMSGSAEILLAEAERLCRSLGCVEVEIRARIPENTPIDGRDLYTGVQEAVTERGYARDAFRPATYLVPLQRDDEQLLNSYSSKCRRDVRKGLREGVAVTELRADEDLAGFFGAQQQMADRKGIESLSEATQKAAQPMYAGGYLRLFAAQYKDLTCNMALVDALGMPRYMLGAATPAAFEKGVPPTGQPLHYEIMRRFRDRGARFYDLGGSPGPVPMEGHPNYTVWRFKHEFGAPYVYMLPYHRKSLSRLGGLALALARKMRRLPP